MLLKLFEELQEDDAQILTGILFEHLYCSAAFRLHS